MNTKKILALILLIIPFILNSQAKVNILIKTNVPGAFIYLNDKLESNTNSNGIAVIKAVPIGEYKIKMEKDGYEPFSKTITISLLGVEFNFSLKKKIILQISCNAAGAEIIIDGKPIGKTDLKGKKTIESVSKGKHTLEIKKKDFISISQSINLNEGENNYNFTLKEITTGKLLLRCNVPGAEIFIDNKMWREKTVESGLTIELPPGNHTVRIEKIDFKAETKMVSIKKELLPTEVTFKIFINKNKNEFPKTLLVALIFFVLASVLVIFIALMRSSRTLGVMGKFELVEIIGKGGIATIYKAKDLMQKRIVALKIMDYTLARDADLVYKFFREGETISQINEDFPNAPVVKVFDYGRDREKSLGIPYISMQLLKGDNLLKILKKGEDLNVQRKLYIAREIVNGLIAAHKLKIFHGDITPDNIIINGKKVILIDFGIAAEGHDNYKKMDASIMGKPVYMSPEQCAGLSIDEKSDVYSLGIILFLMFHGTPPFTAPNPAEIIRMHQESPLPEMDPRIPDEIKEMIIRMLAKEPCSRPGTIELVEILDRLILQCKRT